jgi:hypothetical protein
MRAVKSLIYNKSTVRAKHLQNCKHHK